MDLFMQSMQPCEQDIFILNPPLLERKTSSHLYVCMRVVFLRLWIQSKHETAGKQWAN